VETRFWALHNHTASDSSFSQEEVSPVRILPVLKSHMLALKGQSDHYWSWMDL